MNLRALLELCRISNLPTVWSNATIGFFAGVSLAYIAPEDGSPRDYFADHFIQAFFKSPAAFSLMLLLIVAPFSLMYMGGMILNDVYDRDIDAVERPGRPIPSGRVSITLATWLSICFLGFGFVGIVALGWLNAWRGDPPWLTTCFALALLIAIVQYNRVHQQTAASVYLMGACRSLLVLCAASLQQPPMMTAGWWAFIAGPAISLFAYTVLISIVARNEMQPRWFGGPKTVMNMIAAMPLLDAVWLVVMGLWPASLFCVACAGMTKLAHRKVAGS